MKTHRLSHIILLATLATPTLIQALGRTEIIVQNGDQGSRQFSRLYRSRLFTRFEQQPAMAFKAGINDPQQGFVQAIFFYDGNSIQEIVREGQLVPDGNGFFDSFDDEVKLNEVGKDTRPASRRNYQPRYVAHSRRFERY